MIGGYSRGNVSRVPDHTAANGDAPSTHVYVFCEEDEEEEINTDRVELTDLSRRSRSHLSELSPEDFLTYTIKDGDSLQNLSLRFRIPVSELKRLNNLITDQEFHALKTLRVPIKKHGLLSELKETIENENAADNDSGTDSGEHSDCVVRQVSIRDALSSQGRDAAKFLARMDSDIRGIVASTRSRMDSLDDVTKALSCRRIYPIEAPRRSLFNGWDCGINWWSLLACVLLVGIVGPTVYILNMKLKGS